MKHRIEFDGHGGALVYCPVDGLRHVIWVAEDYMTCSLCEADILPLYDRLMP